jgi:hypothetical protein
LHSFSWSPRKHANHEFSALAIRAFFVPSDQLPLGGGLQYGVEAYYVEDILSLKVVSPVSLAIVRNRNSEMEERLHQRGLNFPIEGIRPDRTREIH